MRRRVPLALCAVVAVAACGSPTSPSSGTAAPAASTLPSNPGATVTVERLAPVLADPRPPQPGLAVRYQAALVADFCVDRDFAAPATSDPTLTVLDRTYALPPDYFPSDLVPAEGAGLDGASGDKLVRAVVIDDLAAMRLAWSAAGLTIELESGYRSYANQAATFNSWVARLGYAAALLRTARPGHSEHQLGTAIDVVSPGWSGRLGDWAAETAEGAWMAAHAWEYGFVMSYPAESTEETCFGYEPWHYRWVGRDVAADHRASGLTLRRFLERYATG